MSKRNIIVLIWNIKKEELSITECLEKAKIKCTDTMSIIETDNTKEAVRYILSEIVRIVRLSRDVVRYVRIVAMI